MRFHLCFIKGIVAPGSPTSPPHTVQQQQQQQQHSVSSATPTPQTGPSTNTGQAFFGNDMPSGSFHSFLSLSLSLSIYLSLSCPVN